MRWLERLRDRLVGSLLGSSKELTTVRNRSPVCVVLYSRTGCHLCEEAKALLERHRSRFGLQITEVDIDHHPAIKAMYDCCVPVVEIDGKLRFRGQVHEILLLRLLKANQALRRCKD